MFAITTTSKDISDSLNEAKDFLRRFDTLNNAILPIEGFDAIEISKQLVIAVEAQMDEGFNQRDQIAGLIDLLHCIKRCESIEQARSLIDDHLEMEM